MHARLVQNFGVPGLALAAGLSSAAVGASIALDPAIVGALAVAAIAIMLLLHPPLRLGVVVGGGLFALQSSAELDRLKLAYFALTFVATLGAASNVVRRHEDLPRAPMLMLLRASAGAYLLVLLSLPPALIGGTSLVAWLRDASAYLLFASAPILALDVAVALSPAALTLVFTACGLLAALSFAVSWIQRRGLASLPLDRLAFPSFLLATSLFCFAAAKVIAEPGRSARWVLVASTIFALLIVTATRSTLVLAVAPLAIVLHGRRQRLARLTKLAVVVPLALAAIIIGARAIADVAGVNQASAASRLTTISSVWKDPSADPSYGERIAENRAALAAFATRPLAGIGLGTPITWQNQFAGTRSTFTLDSSLSLLAKFGLIGISVLLFVMSSYYRFLRLLAPVGATVAHAALVAYAVTVAFWMTLGSPFEDKGFSFGLLLTLAVALSEAVRRPSLERE